MTIKEMLKKVEAFNEVAEAMGANKAELRFADQWMEGYWNQSIPVQDIRSLKKHLNDKYYEDTVKAILNCAEYTLDGAEVEVASRMIAGNPYSTKIRCYAQVDD